VPVDKAALLAAAAGAFAGDRPSIIGVAVSGGGDSLALLHLMQRVAGQAGWRVEAATVDHGLRPEAAAEAAQVAALCRNWGVAHEVLRWETPQAAGNLMDRARRARLALLAEWAGRRGIGHVVLGHTADDQAETLLMGLSRSAGIDGLSGMRSVFREGGVVFARPLLAIPRQDLRDYLAGQGIGWIDDPSNENPAFTRVRARRALKALRPLGITVGRLAAVADHLDMARSALEAATAAAARRLLAERAGAVMLDRTGFLREPMELQRRLALRALRALTGPGYPPREAELNRILFVLVAGGKATLRGTLVSASGDEALFRREARAVAGLVAKPGEHWDGRWSVEGPWQGDEEIRALGAAGLRQCPDWRATGLARGVLEVTPAIWRGERLIAAPSAGLAAGFVATCRAPAQSDPLSH
jgi:tRNA(Ile)-lysidine synthase